MQRLSRPRAGGPGEAQGPQTPGWRVRGGSGPTAPGLEGQGQLRAHRPQAGGRWLGAHRPRAGERRLRAHTAGLTALSVRRGLLPLNTYLGVVLRGQGRR